MPLPSKIFFEADAKRRGIPKSTGLANAYMPESDNRFIPPTATEMAAARERTEVCYECGREIKPRQARTIRVPGVGTKRFCRKPCA